MTDDPKARAVLEKYSSLKSERHGYERMWQDIRDLVRPGTSDFNRFTSPGTTRTEGQYDGTAMQALMDLASALQGNLTNPSDRWFAIAVEGVGEVRDRAALEWLDLVTDIIYDEYANPETNHQSALHENYLDLGGFGTAVQYQEYDRQARHLVFRAYPLADCHIAESSKGRVDTVYRCVYFTCRQMEQEFGSSMVPEKVKQEAEKDPNRKHEVLHCVFPRSDRDSNKYNVENKRFASIWVLKEMCHTLKESGFDRFPYHVPRWEKLAGEVYGRSPATNCLPDIRMLNRMEYTIIKCAQKAVDPPLIADNDAYMLPIKTAPGSINFKEPGSEPLQMLEHRGNIPLGLEMSDQKREAIRKAFYAEWVKLEKKKERQTAYEIAELREEQLQMLAPMLGRIQTELLNPMIALSYNLLKDAGKIPPAPGALAGAPLKVRYVSPAARAQKAVRAISIGRSLQEIAPIIQIKPDVIDAIDIDAAVAELLTAREVPAKVIRNPKDVEEIRAAREQQQQAAIMAETLQPAAKAYRDIAEAQKVGA